jgi:molybdate/tungstate transport system substrate-binding protein
MRQNNFFSKCGVIPILVLVFLLFLPGSAGAEPRGKLIIFNAGSLAIPFKEMSEAFTLKYPGVQIFREAAGSRTCARKITDLKKPCDVMASADYTVIENLLLPDYADWNISFATNEMAIMHRGDSKHAKEINGTNWHEILLRKGVEYGHSDPNCDPCGYRSLLVWQLAEKYYQIPGLYDKLRENCPPRNVRPKETDLIALLEAGQLDYLFIYRSVCEQHKMPFVGLPEEINLKSAAHESFYKQSSIKVSGKKPGEFIKQTGKPMVYGITVPKNAPNKETAIAFVAFVVGPDGQAIMRHNGQPPVSPARATGRVDLMPAQLKKLVK